jgi:hypothetical protein
MMMTPLAALAVLAQSSIAVADAVPVFNLEPICRGIARQGGLDLEPNQTVRQDLAGCLKSEMAVRDRLLEQWSMFKASDEASCVAESGAGGMPSYTELLTCLQMARDASRM